MPSSDAPEVIVARFLESNHYHETLNAFLKEAGLPPEASTTSPGDWTIEKILEEKKQYETSLVYEKVLQKQEQGWTLPAPSQPAQITSLEDASNILAVHVTPSQSPWRAYPEEFEPQRLIVSSADRKLSMLSTSEGHELQKTIDLSGSHNSPVLSVFSITGKTYMTSSMSGHVDLYGVNDHPLSSRRDHSKYVVQVTVTTSRHTTAKGTPFCIIASAGWDHKICIRPSEPPSDMTRSPDDEVRDNLSQNTGQMATISMSTNPESLLFIRHPDTHELYLIVGRRDSTYLYYHNIIEEMDDASPTSLPNLTVQAAGRQNLAPHANAWISFSPSSLASCPSDPTLIAVATPHLPHMKLILVRLLFPSTQEQRPGSALRDQETQASQAQAERALQDREEAAIVLHVSTMAPQTPYSTPQVVWRPDGSGVWVNGDDGVIRGIEVRTGKVISTLKGHEIGSKVRSLWAGMVRPGVTRGGEGEENEQEWLVSGGFDKKVIAWKVENLQA